MSGFFFISFLLKFVSRVCWDLVSSQDGESFFPSFFPSFFLPSLQGYADCENGKEARNSHLKHGLRRIHRKWRCGGQTSSNPPSNRFWSRRAWSSSRRIKDACGSQSGTSQILISFSNLPGWSMSRTSWLQALASLSQSLQATVSGHAELLFTQSVSLLTQMALQSACVNVSFLEGYPFILSFESERLSGTTS